MSLPSFLHARSCFPHAFTGFHKEYSLNKSLAGESPSQALPLGNPTQQWAGQETVTKGERLSCTKDAGRDGGI